MKITQKLENENINIFYKEVLDIFNQSNNFYLNIKDISYNLNISYDRAKHRLRKLELQNE
ncbi:MAG: hypothetical protein ISS82_01475 [Nanoarchaeota archaeon]|nr:hypothetical protein [Nanoarchaeota archaeon]